MRSHWLVCLLLFSAQVEATVFCVSTGQDLQGAFNVAESNGVSDEIRVTIGTHTNNTQAPQAPQWSLHIFGLDDMDQALTISGGWSTGNNCASQVSLNPSDTVLDAQNAGPVLDVFFNIAGFTGSFTLRNLTLNRGKAFVQGQVTGLAVTGTALSPASVTLDNLHIVNGQSTFQFSSALFSGFGDGGTLRLRNSIISLNSLTGADSRAVTIFPPNNGLAFISNNSIFGNSGTTTAAGLLIADQRVATLTNNAVSDNTSTANPNYQFFANAPTNLTLKNNHFATRAFTNGVPFSETGTTTGDPQWTASGNLRVPNLDSPLRDSGDNMPTGGALAIDFRGNPRIANATMDRGAVEADAPPPQGPQVTANSPLPGSTTYLVGESGGPAFGNITFNVSGGIAPGTTQINCQVTSGTILIGANPSQTVGVGQSAEAVLVGFDSTVTPQSGVVFCQFVRVNFGNTFAAYTFKAGPDELFKDGFEK